MDQQHSHRVGEAQPQLRQLLSAASITLTLSLLCATVKCCMGSGW